MSGGNHHADSAIVFEGLGRFHNGATGVDHVINNQTHPAFDLTNDFVHRHLVGNARVATLVNNGKGRTQLVTPNIGNAHAPHIGAHHGEGRWVKFLLDVLQQHRHRKKVIDGPIEETLNLGGVKVNAHDPIGTGGFE